ncbi:MAG: ChaN family lipoprotein, partial [Bacteroidota bacterium]
MKIVLLSFLSICLPVILSAQSTDANYKVYDVKKQKTVTLPDVIKDLKEYDVVFFGEDHNDSIGHMLEAEFFKSMSTAYFKPVLTMEMFYTDTQAVIDDYLSGVISE